MNENVLLVEMLRMHEAGESLSIAFATEHYEGLKHLWEQRLSCYDVTKMVNGRVRARRVFLGVLTPIGLEKAKTLKLAGDLP
jgi:hypothetical protein